MPRKYFRKILPSHQSIRENRTVGLFGGLLRHHNLWHLHRRSVAGGVAVGLFTGLLPAPFQMLSAAIFAIVFHVNLPVAVFTTLYTNPLTFVPLYIVAFHLGALLLGHQGTLPGIAGDFEVTSWRNWIPEFMDWLTALGMPLLVGVPTLGLLFSITGYFAVRGLWRLHVVRQWRRRKKRRSVAG